MGDGAAWDGLGKMMAEATLMPQWDRELVIGVLFEELLSRGDSEDSIVVKISDRTRIQKDGVLRILAKSKARIHRKT